MRLLRAGDPREGESWGEPRPREARGPWGGGREPGPGNGSCRRPRNPEFTSEELPPHAPFGGGGKLRSRVPFRSGRSLDLEDRDGPGGTESEVRVDCAVLLGPRDWPRVASGRGSGDSDFRVRIFLWESWGGRGAQEVEGCEACPRSPQARVLFALGLLFTGGSCWKRGFGWPNPVLGLPC